MTNEITAPAGTVTVKVAIRKETEKAFLVASIWEAWLPKSQCTILFNAHEDNSLVFIAIPGWLFKNNWNKLMKAKEGELEYCKAFKEAKEIIQEAGNGDIATAVIEELPEPEKSRLNELIVIIDGFGR